MAATANNGDVQPRKTWSHLPGDLLADIFERITGDDLSNLYPCLEVCSPWRFAAREFFHANILTVVIGTSTPTKKFYKIGNPKKLNSTILCSNRGWLFLANEMKSKNPSLYLYNPVSRVLLRLPPPPPSVEWSSRLKFITSRNPSFRVCVLFESVDCNKPSILAICKQGDDGHGPHWVIMSENSIESVLKEDHHADEWRRWSLADMIFYRGQFYAIDADKGELFVYNDDNNNNEDDGQFKMEPQAQRLQRTKLRPRGDEDDGRISKLRRLSVYDEEGRGWRTKFWTDDEEETNGRSTTELWGMDFKMPKLRANKLRQLSVHYEKVVQALEEVPGPRTKFQAMGVYDEKETHIRSEFGPMDVYDEKNEMDPYDEKKVAQARSEHRFHLVESTTGELLKVERVITYKSLKKTESFGVFKLNWEKKGWEKVCCFGGDQEALLLTPNDSMFVSVSEAAPPIKQNCIYYLDECWEFDVNGYDVCDLENNTIKHLNPTKSDAVTGDEEALSWRWYRLPNI